MVRPLESLKSAVFFIGLLIGTGIAAAQEDPELAAMPEGPGKEFVYLVCSDCHSMTHVLHRGTTYTRRDWRASLKRMTDEFGMADLSAEETDEVITYLLDHAGAADRR